MSEGFIGATVGGLPTWTFVRADSQEVARFALDGFPSTVLLFPSEETARSYDGRPELAVRQFPDDGTLRQKLTDLERDGATHVGIDPTRGDDASILPIAVVIPAAKKG